MALATALGAAIFSSIRVDYKLFTNIARFLIFAGLFWLTLGRGANDPVCGMRVDRRKALHIDFGGERFYFCSHHCVHAFEVNPAWVPRSAWPHPDPKAKAAGLPVHR